MLSHGFRRSARTRRRHSAPATVLLQTMLHCVHKVREYLASISIFKGAEKAWVDRGGTNETTRAHGESGRDMTIDYTRENVV